MLWLPRFHLFWLGWRRDLLWSLGWNIRGNLRLTRNRSNLLICNILGARGFLSNCRSVFHQYLWRFFVVLLNVSWLSWCCSFVYSTGADRIARLNISCLPWTRSFVYSSRTTILRLNISWLSWSCSFVNCTRTDRILGFNWFKVSIRLFWCLVVVKLKKLIFHISHCWFGLYYRCIYWLFCRSADGNLLQSRSRWTLRSERLFLNWHLNFLWLLLWLSNWLLVIRRCCSVPRVSLLRLGLPLSTNSFLRWCWSRPVISFLPIWWSFMPDILSWSNRFLFSNSFIFPRSWIAWLYINWLLDIRLRHHRIRTWALFNLNCICCQDYKNLSEN